MQQGGRRLFSYFVCNFNLYQLSFKNIYDDFIMIFFLFRRPAAPSSGVSGSVTGFSGSVAGSAVSGSRRRVPAGSRVRAQQSSNNLQTQLNLSGGTDKRTRIPPRQRVRNPNLPGTKFSCYSNFQERQVCLHSPKY